ncbi:hypothetical protein QJS04_geneDACA022951 [Acorus gramineus]|uniref:Uncharacterized protein n=1 Tax=Acorus gramineus TaxID=55184 RepID=A0AAV9BU68_ACOGR|nr:hypothetical protein QJS04_geneDACA022951 [Acorus gramineus]
MKMVKKNVKNSKKSSASLSKKTKKIGKAMCKGGPHVTTKWFSALSPHHQDLIRNSMFEKLLVDLNDFNFHSHIYTYLLERFEPPNVIHFKNSVLKITQSDFLLILGLRLGLSPPP